MSETRLVLEGLRAWGDKLSLETVSEPALIDCLRETVVAQELELSRLLMTEIHRRRYALSKGTALAAWEIVDGQRRTEQKKATDS